MFRAYSLAKIHLRGGLGEGSSQLKTGIQLTGCIFVPMQVAFLRLI